MLAVDPAAADTSTFGTGIGIGTAGADNSNVPPAYVKQKAKQLKDFVATGARPVPPAKTGAAAALAKAQAESLSVLPMSGTGLPTSAYLSWYPGFYQKTKQYCLVAVVQSIAYMDLEAQWYWDLGSGSIIGAQDKIFNGYYNPDGTYNPPIKAAIPPGADDSKAIVWLNRQFSWYHVSWYYVAVLPTSQADFMTYVRFDVAVSYEPTYVRVDLSTPQGTGYMWYQAKNSKGVHALHATLAVGYDDSAGTMRSYDPFTHTLSGGACSYYYNANYDWACNWTISQSRYYRGMDRIVANPVWY